ncbi:Cadmium, cobalt and zinc/H(+)-K(+) antiporter [Marinomonas spartinae]|uniref:Cadmium, cobalt and zinc/H(+)-K(+) antiporter n=2 Tax=Marinomonas spartinae TaxID=1792290 RepID=A0A1A8TQV7_9GAMM|nr:Cadmium, cobalt and zinc/H(+)-K(+) antiporter [Marinomonas spartinae]
MTLNLQVLKNQYWGLFFICGVEIVWAKWFSQALLSYKLEGNKSHLFVTRGYMSHDHSHHVSHYNRAFAIGIALNVFFTAVEFLYGFAADSLALIADAGHNLSDVLSLLLAWGASILGKKAATEKRTYGFRKVTVMASLISAVMLLAALGIIAWEAMTRFAHPAPVASVTMMIVAAIGVVINTVTALLFMGDHHHDLNIKGAFLHMAADAAVSLGVVIAGALIWWKGWLWVDPVISLLIVAVIFIGTWGLLKDSMNYTLDAVPDTIDMPALRRYLENLPEVARIHDLHVWPLSTTEVALTVHLVMKDVTPEGFLHHIQHHLHDEFSIEHATIQIENEADEANCALEHPH